MKRTVSFILMLCLLLALVSCAGEQGIQGPQGEQGIQGPQGEQGENGKDGKSAYELYCEKYGYTGTEEEWLKNIYEALNKLEPQDVYEMAQKAVVTIRAYNYSGDLIGSGSGFFISDDGSLATAYHVIDGAYSLKIETLGGATYQVKNVVAFDAVRDIALLRVTLPSANAYLNIEKDNITPGETAYSFGSSLGFLDGSFASGVVASALREVIIDETTDESFWELQYTAPVSSGNSGGPILNSKGEVIGIVTWGYTIGNSLNFATHIGELDTLDKDYERSVAAFFHDTEYYKIKMLEKLYVEVESNDTQASANVIYSGYSVNGETYTGEYDYYKLTLTEEVDFNIAYVGDTSTIYYPMLIGSGGNSIDLEWVSVEYDGATVYCASVHLSAGTYYACVNGYYDDVTTEYVLYTYWRPWSDFVNFNYDIYYDDIFA